MPNIKRIAGVIIAGGKSSRMQADGIAGDKFLQLLGAQTVLEQVAARISPQVDHLFINTNTDHHNLPDLSVSVIADTHCNHGGPLVGLKTAFEYARDFPFVLSVTADCPFIPQDLMSRLYERQQKTNAPIVIASSNGQLHPIFGLWKTDLLQPLNTWLEHTDKASVLAFARSIGFEVVDFPFQPLPKTTGIYDPFFNINKAEDLINARKLHEALQ
ncbi:molybdenum cofactor guanylyltransferase [Brucella gallinifaecis]|uniref:Molybdenum cofactor guanylyltransferase n=1 Tax=Brucella gallinifaecis TaxID=215590 RepID=A0A502BNN5_9HYPH|nr:molybdenum cofactor guanylyltransferase [Brucella gallinifaecis]TPF75251.1 molybdenum cofactor guanylyltransferase [Brucella gallinifaecis]